VVDSQGNKRICRPQAEVEIMAYFESSIDYDELGQSLQSTGQSMETSVIEICGLKIGKYNDCSYKNYHIKKEEVLLSNILPIRKKIITYYEMDYKQNSQTFDQVKANLIQECEKGIEKNKFDIKNATRIENVTQIKNGYYNILITYKVLVQQNF